MACQLHPSSKFCLFCAVLSLCFHVHLCHKYGDLNHSQDEVKDLESDRGNSSKEYGYGTQSTPIIMKSENASLLFTSDSNSSTVFGPPSEINNASETSEGNWTQSNMNSSSHVGDSIQGVSLPEHPSPPSHIHTETNTSESHKEESNNTSAIQGGSVTISHGSVGSANGEESGERPEFEIPLKNSSQSAAREKTRPHKHRHQPYLMAIFNKYGRDGVMTVQDLERLMHHLGLGMKITTDLGQGKLMDENDKGSESQVSSKVKRSHHQQRKNLKHPKIGVENDHMRGKRAVSVADGELHGLRHQRRHNASMSNECLSVTDVMSSVKLSTSDEIIPETFLKICPVLIYQLDTRACGHIDHGHGHLQDTNSSDFHGANENSTLLPMGNQNLNESRNTSSHDDHMTIEHRHGRLNQDPHGHESHESHDGHFHDNDHSHDGEDGHPSGDSHHQDHDHDHDHEAHDDDSPVKETVTSSSALESVPVRVWGYSIVSCLIISLVGLVCVAIIPCMHKVVYNHLLQFLVALAIGSLTGDALLHLLPHAMEDRSVDHTAHPVHDEDSGHEEPHSHDRRPIWLGLVALGGIYLFFLMERVMGLVTDCKRKRHLKNKRQKRLSSPLLLRRLSGTEVGPKLPGSTCSDNVLVVHTSKEVTRMAEESHQEVHKDCDQDAQEEWGVGHSHGNHQHSHQVPGTVAAVAWMVIVGDGLHNFSDGLAIGASFASSLSGGLSTSIAVACHELPHELGDFAVLLRAGMSVKSALLYNLVSSVLCFIGMAIGVAIGNIAEADQWIFALIAGIFIYVALVDMLPEMTKVDPRHGENPCVHLVLQNAGMLTGGTIMLLIAMYEHNITLPAF